MGWLGWSEETTLDTTISGLMLAYEGHVDKLKACYGSGDAPPATEIVKELPPSGESLRAIFRKAAKPWKL